MTLALLLAALFLLATALVLGLCRAAARGDDAWARARADEARARAYIYDHERDR